MKIKIKSTLHHHKHFDIGIFFLSRHYREGLWTLMAGGRSDGLFESDIEINEMYKYIHTHIFYCFMCHSRTVKVFAVANIIVFLFCFYDSS